MLSEKRRTLLVLNGAGLLISSLLAGWFYFFFLLGAIDAFVRADWQYEADTDFGDGGSAAPINAALEDLYDREVNNVNASLGFTSANGLGITFWGRNIFDHEYITTAFPGVAQAGTWTGYPSQPQTYGVTVRKTF